jgi:hypothetical protein
LLGVAAGIAFALQSFLLVAAFVVMIGAVVHVR